MSRLVLAVWRKELLQLAGQPYVYAASAVFAISAALITLQLGDALRLGVADLDALFAAAPWLLSLFVPILTASAWAGEARAGTLELTLSLPQPSYALAIGKWLAAWSVAGLALLTTLPLWITMTVLGQPDHAETLVGYLMTFLAAGTLAGFGSAISASTRSKTVAITLAATISILALMPGLQHVQRGLAAAFGDGAADLIAIISTATHLEAARNGVVEVRSLFFFVSMTAVFLAWTALALDARRSGDA